MTLPQWLEQRPTRPSFSSVPKYEAAPARIRSEMSQPLVLTAVPEAAYQRIPLPATLATSGPSPPGVVGAPAGNLALKAAEPSVDSEARAARRLGLSGGLFA